MTMENVLVIAAGIVLGFMVIRVMRTAVMVAAVLVAWVRLVFWRRM